MTLEELEKQVLFWNKSAIIIPVVVTVLLLITYAFSLLDIRNLFLIACGLYFFTAVVWWWWTMKSVHLLVKILKNTNEGIQNVSVELRSIRKELSVDNQTNK